MQDVPYLSNVVAQHDINDLSLNDGSDDNAPHLIFSIEQIAGEHECVVVQADALTYAAGARIDDTGLFADALIDYARHGQEVFFEMDYIDFTNAFPFQQAADILRLGILVVPSADGFRIQTLTLLDDGTLMHDPYYMFLPTEKIEDARQESVSEDFSHAIFEGMEVEFPSAIPTPGSPFEAKVAESLPVSATLATIGLSLLALKAESEATSEEPLPVVQAAPNAPKIVSLSVE